MIKNRRFVNIGLFLLLTVLFIPKQIRAVGLNDVVDAGSGLLVRVQETFEYVFAVGVEKKIEILDKQADRRLERAQMYAEEGKGQRVENMISNYGEIKERQNELMGKIDDSQMMNQIAEKVVEQQQTMEEIKNWVVDPGTKEQMIQVQEQVVNQVAKNIVEVNGSVGATEFVNEVAHVWAPGTGPGGEAGIVYEGGGKLIYAPGTGPGGQGGVVIEGGEMKFAPGTGPGAGNVDVQNVVIEGGGGQGQQVEVQQQMGQ